MKNFGKIDKTKITALFSDKRGKASANIQQGPAFGVDTGIISLSEDKSLVIASDPASFIPSLGIKESAWLTVNLTANDVATSGYLPKYAQFVLNLPHTMTDQELTIYWRYIHQFCLELGISITGGHTGFDDIGASTLAGGTTMFTVADTTKVKTSALAGLHQKLILTKSTAFSSSAILAKSFPNHTKAHLGNEMYKTLERSFYQTSIFPEIQILKENPDILEGVSAMHDVTEGGALGAVYELCEASKVGVKINKEAIPVGHAQHNICQLFQINPLRALGTGSLLIACDKKVSMPILNEFHNKGISAAVIGETRPVEEGKQITTPQDIQQLTYWDKDPYWEAFFKALENQLK